MVHFHCKSNKLHYNSSIQVYLSIWPCFPHSILPCPSLSQLPLLSLCVCCMCICVCSRYLVWEETHMRFFFILNLTLMHRKFDQNRKALLQRTLPRLFSLPSVIRKSAATVWPAAIHVSSSPLHKESCAQNRSLGWSSLKRESSEMGAGAFLLPFSPFYPAWLAITALLP